MSHSIQSCFLLHSFEQPRTTWNIVLLLTRLESLNLCFHKGKMKRSITTDESLQVVKLIGLKGPKLMQ